MLNLKEIVFLFHKGRQIKDRGAKMSGIAGFHERFVGNKVFNRDAFSFRDRSNFTADPPEGRLQRVRARTAVLTSKAAAWLKAFRNFRNDYDFANGNEVRTRTHYLRPASRGNSRFEVTTV